MKIESTIPNQTAETELFLNDNYRSEFSDTQFTTNKEIKVLLKNSHDHFPTVIKDQSVLRKVSELLNEFDPNIFYVHLSINNELRVSFNDKNDPSINDSG